MQSRNTIAGVGQVDCRPFALNLAIVMVIGLSTFLSLIGKMTQLFFRFKNMLQGWIANVTGLEPFVILM